MNFGSKWLRWIEACVCSASFWVLINGSPTDDFKARRGLRQGDPLSPFLFILAAEGLARLMHNTLSSHYFLPFSINDDLHISLLQFADDTMIVGTPSWENIGTLKGLLRGFELCSGLSVNFSKSKILGFNVEMDFLQAASDFLFCAISPFPFQFLGISIGCNPRRKSAWSLITTKLRNMLALWRGN
ncbi:uncharacterized protein LOC131626685 [Vicia villosa]|uniref:uncharacterized protein LOC131626685 n=1 Tax=Vicia villosa TaxID=3911 RepID=UPI00273C3185|nr:uncharacterized protein LOC131626685 [Vicia villosa]